MNRKGFIDIIVVSVFAVFFVVAGIGFFTSRQEYRKSFVSLDKYNGEFKNTVTKGRDYLVNNYSSKNFDITFITDNPSHISEVISGTTKPEILLNLRDINDQGWIKDFNLVADMHGINHLENTQDHALFLLGHEYRHLLQWSGVVKDLHTLNPDDKNFKNVPAYHRQPSEADADWFGLKLVQDFKNK